MRKGALSTGAALALVLAARVADARTHETFYGWSKDGSWYVVAYAGTDELDQPTVCVSASGEAPPASWPKGAPKPEEGEDCAAVCDMTMDDCEKIWEQAPKWVELPRSAPVGPKGQKVTLAVRRGKATISLVAAGKKIASAVVELDHEDEKPDLLGAYWRPDGGAVAVQLGYADTPADDDTPGWGPPLYLQVLAPAGPHDRALAANRRGMKLLRQKKPAPAEAEFRAAVAAEPTYVQGHYNLACAAALAGDKKTAAAELGWLAASADPLAREKLVKARTDPDLVSVRGLPEVAKLLAP